MFSDSNHPLDKFVQRFLNNRRRGGEQTSLGYFCEMYWHYRISKMTQRDSCETALSNTVERARYCDIKNHAKIYRAYEKLAWGWGESHVGVVSESEKEWYLEKIGQSSYDRENDTSWGDFDPTSYLSTEEIESEWR